MAIRKIMIFIILISIAGCKKPASDGPRILRARFLNENFTVKEPVKVDATIASPLPVTISYEWSVNGFTVNDITTSTLPTRFFVKMDKIECTIIVKDSLGKESEPFELGPVVVENTLPVITWADISPTDSIYKGIDLSVDVQYDDADEDDDVTIQYTWYVGKSLVSSDSVLNGQLLEAGKNVTVELIPYDGDTTGELFEITRPIIVQNLPPRIIGTPVPVTKDSVVTCKINAEDPDGDPISYSIEVGPPGMTIDNTGTLQWKFPVLDKDTVYNLIIKVTDSKGAGEEIQIPLRMTKSTPEE